MKPVKELAVTQFGQWPCFIGWDGERWASDVGSSIIERSEPKIVDKQLADIY